MGGGEPRTCTSPAANTPGTEVAVLSGFVTRYLEKPHTHRGRRGEPVDWRVELVAAAVPID